MKRCSTCKIEKSLCDFYNRKDRKDGKVSQCKDCCKKTEQKRKTEKREEYLEKLKYYNKKYCDRRREKRREKIKNCPEFAQKQKNKSKKSNTKRLLNGKTKEYREKNSLKIKERQRIYYQNNKKQRNEYLKTKRKKDINFDISCKLRSSITCRIRYYKGKKSKNTINLLGCTFEFFRQYIESKFQEGMSWENHGTYGWHLDHIIPCSYFDLTKEEEQKKCFHYSNYQPLWAGDNLRKGNRYSN